MKTIFFYSKLLLIVGLLVGLGWLFKSDAGYIIVDVGTIHYESSLFLLIIVLLGLWFVWYLLKLILRSINFTFKVLNPWHKTKQLAKSTADLHQGLIFLCAENNASAIKHFSKGKTLAHQLLLLKTLSLGNQTQESTKVAQKLAQQYPQTKMVSEILQSKTLLNAKKYQLAEPKIKQLFTQYKNNYAIINLLKKLLISTKNWQELFNLSTKHKQLLTGDEFIMVWNNYLKQLDITNEVMQSFYKLDKEYANHPEVITAYAYKLQQLNRTSEAEQIVRRALKKHYHSSLIKVYGDIKHNEQQLNFALTLVDKNKQDHNLYITLAKLSLRQNSYTKAQAYLEQSVALNPNNEAYNLLASVLIKLDDKVQALVYLNKIN